jgi:hypothetical protein
MMLGDRVRTARRVFAIALVIALSLGGCAAGSKQERDALAQAGFTQVRADNTLQHDEALNKLPANQFTHRSINGVDTVLYYDPTCKCVYSGTQHDYQKYFDELETERAGSGGP